MEMTDRSKWTVKEHQRALTAHVARTSECTSDLESGLCHYELNDDFCGPVVNLPVLHPVPKFPATATLHSLTKSDHGAVPMLNLSHVKEYPLCCQVKSTNLESLALQRCKKVMNECICAARYNVDNGTFFLPGIVSAEMKKVT